MYEEYIEHFSAELSEDIKKYCIDEVLLKSRYIFTERRGKQQYGYCTNCNKEFRTSGLKHKEKTSCPHCGSKCEVRASGISRKYMYDDAYFVYYEKSIKDPDVIVARGIYTSRDYKHDYKNIKTSYLVKALYVFKIGGSILLEKSYYDGCFNKSPTIYSLEHNRYNGILIRCSKDSIKSAIKDTPFQYSMWETFNDGSDMVKYFAMYSKYPLIEQLTKIGFGNMVKAKLYGSRTYGVINWRADNVFKALRLNRKELKEFTASMKVDSVYSYVNASCTALSLRLYQISVKDKSNLNFEETRKIAESFAYQFQDLKKVLKYATLRKIDKYINEQYKKYKKSYTRLTDVLITWKDYIADCEKLGIDLDKDSNLTPKDIYTSHQNTIRQIKINENKELTEKINKRIKDVNKKYSFEFNGLIIRAAESSIELIDEGKALNHCVGGYAERYASGETNILFIRKTSDINTPFYTMEVRGNTIIQTRGKRNCNPTKEVQELIERFKDEKLTKNKKSKIKIPA